MDINEKFVQAVQKLTLLDDIFMRVVFNDEKNVQFLIRKLLQNEKLIVKEVNVQADYKNLRGKSAILDIVAVDEDEKIYNIEVQRDDVGASVQRARYHSSLLDTNIDMTGQDIRNLPNTYVIFITQNDVLKGNKQIYHITRVIKETSQEFNDGTNIIYVNASMQTDTQIGRLMHDFRCEDPNDMNYKELSEVVREYKQTREGEKKMCKVMEDLFEELKPVFVEQGKIEGKIEGKMEGKLEGVLLVYRDDLNIGKQEAIDKLSKKFSLSNEEATIYVNKYYN